MRSTHSLMIILGAMALLSSCSSPMDKSHTQSQSSTQTANGQSASPITSSSWESDFTAFAEAVKSAIKRGDNLEAKFTGRPIQWDVTFRKFSRVPPAAPPMQERGYLYFDEAVALQGENPAIDIHADLRKDAFKEAAKLKPGQKLTIRCKIGIAIQQFQEGILKMVIIGPSDCEIR
jgi:hypothetical protein